MRDNDRKNHDSQETSRMPTILPVHFENPVGLIHFSLHRPRTIFPWGLFRICACSIFQILLFILNSPVRLRDFWQRNYCLHYPCKGEAFGCKGEASGN
jgi:hypothetical protein